MSKMPIGGTHPDIESLYEAATRPGRNGNDYFVDFSVVDLAESDLLRAQTGMEFSGYVHTLDESAIRHIIRRHGLGGEALVAGEEPVTRDDILRIPDITASPDNLTAAGKNDRGLEVIEYRKRIDGWIYYIAEARTGRRKLATVTMYKQRAGGGPPTQQPPPTLRPNRARPQTGRLDVSARPASAAGPSDIIGANSPKVKPADIGSGTPTEGPPFGRAATEASKRGRKVRP